MKQVLILFLTSAVVSSLTLPKDRAAYRELDSLGGGNILRRIGGLRSLDSLGGGRILRQLDSLGGGHILRDLSSQRGEYEPMGRALLKRNFDEIDRSGFGRFVKKNFDEIDRAGFGRFVKKNFDEIDRSGFGGLVKKGILPPQEDYE